MTTNAPPTPAPAAPPAPTSAAGAPPVAAPPASGAPASAAPPSAAPAAAAPAVDGGLLNRQDGAQATPAAAAPAAPAAPDAPKAAVVPEAYTFKAPEGIELNKAAIEKISPVFKKLGLTQEAAQGLVDWQLSQEAEAQKNQQAAQKAYLVEQEKLTLAALGPQANAELAHAKRALTSIPGLDKILRAANIDSSLPVIQALAALGRTLAEETPDRGSSRAPAGSKSKTDWDKVFPSTAGKGTGAKK